jgi:hypothetical protein
VTIARETRNACRTLDGKPLENIRMRSEDNIEISHKFKKYVIRIEIE